VVEGGGGGAGRYVVEGGGGAGFNDGGGAGAGWTRPPTGGAQRPGMYTVRPLSTRVRGGWNT
jgi:hypothetical protein